MKRIFLSLVVFLSSLTSIYAQTGGPTKSNEIASGKGNESSQPSAATDALASGSKVDGLELPPDQTAANDEGFVTLQAKTKGNVKWLVVAEVKVKYVSIPDNSIIVSIPPQGGIITVFAVAAIDGKLTDFARTNITVKGAQPATNPVPGPGTGPGTLPPGLHVTFFVDLNNTTAEMAAILNSKNLQNAITSKGNFFRYYDIKSPVVSQKKLDAALQKAGGSFVVIVQRNDGVVLLSQPVPRTEQELAVLLQKVGAM